MLIRRRMSFTGQADQSDAVSDNSLKSVSKNQAETTTENVVDDEIGGRTEDDEYVGEIVGDVVRTWTRSIGVLPSVRYQLDDLQHTEYKLL